MRPAGIRMRVDILPWPLTVAEFHGVSSHTDSITITINGVYVYLEVASAWSTALIMSSSSYFGLAVQELVHRKRKKLITAPKFSSSGKGEHYVIPQVIELLKGLPKNSMGVRNVLSSVCISVGGIAQWLAILSQRPCEVRDLARRWYQAKSSRRS
jgi:hypothetical protein